MITIWRLGAITVFTPSFKTIVKRRGTIITAHRPVGANGPAVTLSVIVVVHNVSREIDNRAKWPSPSCRTTMSLIIINIYQ